MIVIPKTPFMAIGNLRIPTWMYCGAVTRHEKVSLDWFVEGRELVPVVTCKDCGAQHRYEGKDISDLLSESTAQAILKDISADSLMQPASVRPQPPSSASVQ